MSEIKLSEKYENSGWPAVRRPDVKPPEGWSLSLVTAVSTIHSHKLSPDGQQIAFVWQRDDLSDIYVMPVEGGWPRRVSTERAATWSEEQPQWSPDGRWLAFSMNEHVYVASTSWGLANKISGFAESASNPIWLPDSTRLIISVERDESTQLLLTDRDGRWPQPLVARSDGDAWDVRPSPDGRSLAYTFRPFDDLNRLDIHLLELAGGQVTELIGAPKVRNWFARWSPDGSCLAFLSQQSGWNEIWLVRPGDQQPRQLTQLGHDVAEFSWSPAGDSLAAVLNRGGSLNLAVVDVHDSRVKDLDAGIGVYWRPQWAPGGDWLTVEFESPVQPPDLYKVELTDGRRIQLTNSAPATLPASTLVLPERVSYQSYDGLEIPAFLFRPARPNGAAVLYPHGGPSLQYLEYWDPLVQYFVAKGYTWLCPNYRGSTGYGLAFEHANYNDWGGGDTQDCLHGARFLAALDGVDPGRIAIYGGSYGGYMVACCLSRDPEYRFACGIDKYGDANLISSWAQCNRDLRLYSQIFLGHPALNRQIYVDGSPIYQVENIRKPLLILHGLDDDVVPPQASEEWVMALKRAGKDYEYKTYAGEPHGFLKRANQLDAYGRIERFLDWHLLP